MKVKIFVMWLAVTVLLVVLAFCQWQTRCQVTGLQEQMSMRPPVVVLSLETEDNLKSLPEDLQKKILRLAAAGYLVLKRSQIMVAPDNSLLLQQALHEKRH